MAAFLALRRSHPNLPRPFKSPLGRFGGGLTIGICLVTLICQVQDPLFLQGSVWVLVWLALAVAYSAVVARHWLILTPEAAAVQKALQDRNGGNSPQPLHPDMEPFTMTVLTTRATAQRALPTEVAR